MGHIILLAVDVKSIHLVGGDQSRWARFPAKIGFNIFVKCFLIANNRPGGYGRRFLRELCTFSAVCDISQNAFKSQSKSFEEKITDLSMADQITANECAHDRPIFQSHDSIAC